MLQFVFIFFQMQRCIISLFSLLEHILWENITCIGARWVHLPWYVKPSKAGEYLTDSILHQVAQMLNSVAALLLREPELTKDDARKKAFLSISISQALSFVQRGLDGEKNQRRGDYSLCRSIYPAVLYHTAMMHEIVNILKSFPPYWVNVCFFCPQVYEDKNTARVEYEKAMKAARKFNSAEGIQEAEIALRHLNEEESKATNSNSSK